MVFWHLENSTNLRWRIQNGGCLDNTTQLPHDMTSSSHATNVKGCIFGSTKFHYHYAGGTESTLPISPFNKGHHFEKKNFIAGFQKCFTM